jgi:predicted butyrate kinase (DUF1464 family)
MPRVIGIDVGTTTTDLCGMDDGRVFLAQSLPTSDALASPATLIAILEGSGHLDLVVGPSGYGLPLTRASDLTAEAINLATLAVGGDLGGIHGFTSLLRSLATSSLPIVLTPGVIHLPSVPAHRKINRIDMGTADKVCACALAIHQRARESGSLESDVSFLMLETGGAFSAALAVANGAIVDGLGGTSGPMGLSSAGAWDGEVTYLAGSITKDMLFSGGARSVANADATGDYVEVFSGSPDGQAAWSAYVEGAVKALAALATSVPGVRNVVLSGRLARERRLHDELVRRLAPLMGKAAITVLEGFTREAKNGAQGAALVADGLAGGAAADLVRAMRIREASGTVLDHLYVISRDDARRRLGLA